MNINSKECRQKYVDLGLGTEWKTFARRIQKNPFLKSELINKQKGICPVCNKPLKYGQLVGHHLSYDNYCKLNEVIKILHPTPKRPNGMRKTTNCSKCKKKHPEWYSFCCSLLVIVHQRCHLKIHNITTKE